MKREKQKKKKTGCIKKRRHKFKPLFMILKLICFTAGLVYGALNIQFTSRVTHYQYAFDDAAQTISCFLDGVQGYHQDWTVRIRPNILPVDGQGKILGHASPIIVQDVGTRTLPIEGTMTFDAHDVYKLHQEGQLRQVIVHEMLHVLGFGTLWETNGCVFGCSQWNIFKCKAAHSMYRKMGGVGTLAVEDTGSKGSRCGHWKESIFKDELGSPSIDVGVNPISMVTVASFYDLGFKVKYDCKEIDRNFRFPRRSYRKGKIIEHHPHSYYLIKTQPNQ